MLFAAACMQRQEAKVNIVAPPAGTVKHVTLTPVIKDTLCIAAVGDMMPGTSFPDSTYLPADSGHSSFARVKKYLLDAEFAFGNLEGTLLDKGKPSLNKRKFNTRQFYFRMPTTYANIFKDAGFKVLSLANNHSGDFADSGRISTMRTLDNARLNYAGLVVCPSVQFQINGVKYGFCAFAPNSGTAPIYDLKGATQTISDLKQQCDIVIVSFHGGGEGPEFEHVPRGDEIYHGEPRGNVRA
ncbi:MAG TPA: CapA family protein, partial [Mucilaginibacter sp.]|nr:CapA family protein [Mucilaginibacter sp.]